MGDRFTLRFGRLVLAALVLVITAACGTSGTGSTATSAPAGAATEATAAGTGISATSDPAGANAEGTAAGVTTEGTAAAGGVPNLNGRRVVVGTDAAYPPFESVDPTSNQIVGFDVDLMNEIGRLANFQPEFRNAAFDTIFVALDRKEFDAVMSATTITEERQQVVNFSEPYIEVGQLVVTSADNETITRHEDLANAAAVGVQTGTTGETAALEAGKVPDANLRRYQTIDLAFADLANNSIDAVVADGPTVGNYTAQEQYAGKLKIVGEPFTTESYGIAVNKTDTELLNAINAALAQIKSTDTIQQLKDKYQIK